MCSSRRDRPTACVALPGPVTTLLGRPNRATLEPLVAELCSRSPAGGHRRAHPDGRSRASARIRGGKVVRQAGARRLSPRQSAASLVALKILRRQTRATAPAQPA